MKKLIIAFMFGLMAIAAQAEATFDQVQGLIEQRQYQAAASGLEEIIRNHPKSAKAFYAMAQAQAGLGNLEKAQKALNIATGLNPTLDFAPASSVASLKQAITPQVAKIETIESSHFWRNALMVLFALTIFGGIYMLWRKKEDEARAAREKALAELEAERKAADAKRKQEHMEMLAQQEAERQALRAHRNYGNERFDPTNPDVLLPKKTKAQLKAEADAMALREAQARAEAAEADARRARLTANYTSSTPAPTHTTVVNNSGSDMLTGVLIGNMISNSGHNHSHSHDTTRVVEREVVRETPAPSRSSSWDDTPAAPSRSSSWDDAPSKPSRSSSWDDDSSSSSSKSSSSWSSSSDSSSSSSSWDSGSSSSDSSSSSSWD